MFGYCNRMMHTVAVVGIPEIPNICGRPKNIISNVETNVNLFYYYYYLRSIPSHPLL